MSRVKHLFAVVLAALMLCLLMPVAAFAEEASDGKMIVYAKLPSDWSDPHLWAWADDGTNAFDAWPGGEMEADSNNDGWYYCWIPETTNNIIINANDAAVQTSDYKLESKNAWVTVTDAENVEIRRRWLVYCQRSRLGEQHHCQRQQRRCADGGYLHRCS